MKTYYFTFGYGHPLGGFVQRVFAPCEAKAREAMFRAYADRWAFCYGPFGANDPIDRDTLIVDLNGYKYRKLGKDLHGGWTP